MQLRCAQYKSRARKRTYAAMYGPPPFDDAWHTPPGATAMYHQHQGGSVGSSYPADDGMYSLGTSSMGFSPTPPAYAPYGPGFATAGLCVHDLMATDAKPGLFAQGMGFLKKQAAAHPKQAAALVNKVTATGPAKFAPPTRQQRQQQQQPQQPQQPVYTTPPTPRDGSAPPPRRSMVQTMKEEAESCCSR